jgi:hypothetical protein
MQSCHTHEFNKAPTTEKQKVYPNPKHRTKQPSHQSLKMFRINHKPSEYIMNTSQTNTISGAKNATHQTRSLPFALRTPAPPALGAGGMLVPCGELGVAVVNLLSVEERAEDGRGEDVALAGVEEGDGVGLVRAEDAADASEDRALEAADAREDAAFEA